MWSDDPGFPCRTPRGAALSDVGVVADAVMSQPLARDRPLWEMWVVDAPEGGGFALVVKAHQCMVDGLAAVELGTVLLDPTPDQASESRPAPEAESTPAPVALLARAVIDRVREQLSVVRAALELAIAPAAARRADRHDTESPGAQPFDRAVGAAARAQPSQLAGAPPRDAQPTA
jgi:diacylglycerol O-acyltransferase